MRDMPVMMVVSCGESLVSLDVDAEGKSEGVLGANGSLPIPDDKGGELGGVPQIGGEADLGLTCSAHIGRGAATGVGSWPCL